jgi:hypothetical protein
MSGLKETKKNNPLLTAGIVCVVSIIGCVLLFFLVQVISDDEGHSHRPPPERTYEIRSSAKLGTAAFASADAFYEADAAIAHDDHAAFSKIVRTKAIRLPAGTPVQLTEMPGNTQDGRAMVEVRVLSGEHKGKRVYVHAFELH